MIKHILYLITICFLITCSSPHSKPVIYYLGDSHFARLDVDWWFPEFTNENMAVSGAGIEKIHLQYEGIYNTSALCIVEIGTNNMKNAANFDVDRNDLRNFLVSVYTDEINKLSERFKETYLISVLPVSLRYESDNIMELGEFYRDMNVTIDSISNQYNNIFFIDVQTKMATKHPLFLDNNLTIDELHLNDLGYKVLTGIMKNEIFK